MMTKATPQEQRLLLDLQATDLAIRRLEHRRTNLPEQQALDEHQEHLARITADFAAAREEHGVVEKRQARLEQEVATVDSRRKSEEGRMYSGLITSEKELEAIRGELTSLKGRKSELEDQLLEVMERREELDGMISSLQERHGELTGQVGEMTAARDDAATGIDSELAELHAAREEQVATVPEQLRTVYEGMQGRRGGVAVAELQGRTCSGCNLELTAIELEEVKEDAKTSLAYCAQCERILVPAG
jgi:uncharacterized protein